MFLLLLFPFFDLSFYLCCHACMKTWIWFISEEHIENLQRKPITMACSALLLMCKTLVFNNITLSHSPQAAQRMEPLEMPEPGCPEALVPVSVKAIHVRDDTTEIGWQSIYDLIYRIFTSNTPWPMNCPVQQNT